MIESMTHVKRNIGAETADGGDSGRKEKTAFARVLYGAPSADIFFDVFFNKGEAKRLKETMVAPKKCDKMSISKFG